MRCNALLLHISGGGAWLTALRRYMAFALLANVLWEIAQLPLYTIWRQGSLGEIAFAIIHCTGGDLLIASVCLLGAIVLLGNERWPNERYILVAAFTVIAGVGYTVFSEWLNVAVRRRRSYTDLMPVLPIIGTGLSPLAQWIVIPITAFWWMRRAPRDVTCVTQALPQA